MKKRCDGKIGLMTKKKKKVMKMKISCLLYNLSAEKYSFYGIADGKWKTIEALREKENQQQKSS